MMNAAKETALTGCWLKQVNGQAYDQTDRQRLAWHLAGVAFDDPRLLMLVPLEIMWIQMEAIMLQELEIARGIYIDHAKEADDVYLDHVERFEGTARNIVDKFFERF